MVAPYEFASNIIEMDEETDKMYRKFSNENISRLANIEKEREEFSKQLWEFNKEKRKEIFIDYNSLKYFQM